MASLKRISKDNYIRPNKTKQDDMTKDEFEQKLNGYKQISDVRDLVIGNHLRYMVYLPKEKKYLFRMGGFLKQFGPEYKYMILHNGNVSWSVQINDNTTFFRQLTKNELLSENKKHDDYDNQKDKILEMKALLKKQYEENKELKKKLKNIK